MLPVALQPTEATSGLNFTAVSKFIANPTKPAHVDPLAKERRRRLLELTKQSLPDGKVPDPFSLTSDQPSALATPGVKLSEPSTSTFSRWELLLKHRRLVTWSDPVSDQLVPL